MWLQQCVHKGALISEFNLFKKYLQPQSNYGLKVFLIPLHTLMQNIPVVSLKETGLETWLQKLLKSLV